MADKNALMQRLEGFLGKIQTRFDEICAETEQGVVGVFQNDPTDLHTVSTALGGVDHRMMQLRDKVQDTWDDKIESMFEDAGEAFTDQGRDRIEDFKEQLEQGWELFKVKLIADHCRRIWPEVQAQMGKPTPCTQCGTPLTLPSPLESASIPCPSCATVNQVFPPAVVAMYFGAGVEAFASEQSIPLRLQMNLRRYAVDRQLRAKSWPTEGIETLQEWHDMQLAEYQKHAEVKAQMLGKPVDQEWVDSRMRMFLQYGLEMNQTWRKAKGL